MAIEQDIFVNVDWERGERIKVTRTPVQGPTLPGYAWLLDQDTWWYPYRRPAVLIKSMDKPWRYNTVRFLERKASGLHADVGSRHMHNAPDDVWASWQAENPLQWLRSQPLMRVLGKGLPHPESERGKALAVRAIHWHTCRMRKTHPGRLDRCTCITDGRGRTIGAHNDPDSIRRADIVMLSADDIAGWLQVGQDRMS